MLLDEKCTLNRKQNKWHCYALQANAFRACLSACTTCFQLYGAMFENDIGIQLLQIMSSQISGMDLDKMENPILKDTRDFEEVTNSNRTYCDTNEMTDKCNSCKNFNLDQDFKAKISDSFTCGVNPIHNLNQDFVLSNSNLKLYSHYRHDLDLFALSHITTEMEPSLKVMEIQGTMKLIDSSFNGNTWLDNLLKECQQDSTTPFAIICSKDSYQFFIMVHPLVPVKDPKYTLFDPNLHKRLHLDPGFYYFKRKESLFRHLNLIFQSMKNKEDKAKMIHKASSQYQHEDHIGCGSDSNESTHLKEEIDYFVVQLSNEYNHI